MNILILGSTGFIGKNILEYLIERGYNVYAPNHKLMDVLDEKGVIDVLKNGQYDVVINALDRNGKENSYFENRLRMFQNLAIHSDLYGKMIYFGSGAEYGRELPVCNIEENQINRVIPSDTYGFCLQQMNDYARKSENIYNFRLFGIFGKYELWNQRFKIGRASCRERV